MHRQVWFKVATFVALIWGVWALLDRPAFFTTRRPSSISPPLMDPRSLVAQCREKEKDVFADLAHNAVLEKDGSFVDSKSFFRPYRVIWNDEAFVWELQEQMSSEKGESYWETLARFWDVDGDFYPDEAMLLVDSTKAQDWKKRIDFFDWNFTDLRRDENGKLAWYARLDSKDWSPRGSCYAWVNPVAVLMNWAMMNYGWSPTQAHPDVIRIPSQAHSDTR